MKRYIAVLGGAVLVLAAQGNFVWANITFGSRDSAIKVADNGNLNISYALPVTGKIVKTPSGVIQGFPITFNNGLFEIGSSEYLLNGSLKNNIITLAGSQAIPHHFDAEPGFERYTINVQGGYNLITGMPVLAAPITLQDASTTLTVRIQSRLDNNIVLNGGTIFLEDDLGIDQGASFVGEGIIIGNGYSIRLGSKLGLSGQVTFSGVCHVVGDDNIFDLPPGGTISIASGSQLYLADLKLAGLGKGILNFEDDTAELHLVKSDLELSATYVITKGKVFVEAGQSSVITRDYALRFINNAKLILDGENVEYSVRDKLSIFDTIVTGGSTITAYTSLSASDFVASNPGYRLYKLNGGSIIRKEVEYSGRAFVEGNLFLHSDNRLVLDNTDIVSDFENAHGRFVHFARGEIGLLKVESGRTVVTGNIIFKNFEPQHIQLGESGNDARLIFGDQTTIELGSDIELRKVIWEFRGDCVIDGKGKKLNFGEGASIKIGAANSSITFKDIIVSGISGALEADPITIYCLDDSDSINFSRAELIIDTKFTFSNGSINILDDTKVTTTTPGLFGFVDETPFATDRGIFAYTSDEPMTIARGATFLVDRGVTFSWDSRADFPQGSQNLTIDGRFRLNGAQLWVTSTGLELKRENNDTRVIFEDVVQLVSDVSTTQTERALKIDNDVIVEVLSAGVVDVIGPLVHTPLS